MDPGDFNSQFLFRVCGTTGDSYHDTNLGVCQNPVYTHGERGCGSTMIGACFTTVLSHYTTQFPFWYPPYYWHLT